MELYVTVLICVVIFLYVLLVAAILLLRPHLIVCVYCSNFSALTCVSVDAVFIDIAPGVKWHLDLPIWGLQYGLSFDPQCELERQLWNLLCMCNARPTDGANSLSDTTSV